ncbi:hypothetical protein GCM10018781_71210 [Kitasatospora indigofera]|uniref:Outer membrane channel protein CpnT-like N-terminal domain-containing protein n=1 Tax=Kitasatospora indigofera TaxID=67307 RepID=A0A919L4M3_9ACTN|nr:hypothetical protein [Kitasatospora indigofera]GHH83622.1 hypothetical protein GCM10018781_71210 [Kitasatospora indigofera]
MAVELPEPLQWVLLLLAGTRWPEADEDMLRDMAERWRQGAETLKDAGEAADSALKRALEGQQGVAAEALAKHWAQFTVGKGTEQDPGYFPGLVQACNGMGDMLEAMANSAETAKIQIIAQLGILAFEVATAEAEAPFTAGLSLAEIPVFVGISRTVVQQILKKLLKEALEFAAKQAAQMAAINLMAQSIELMEGHRKSIDMKELGQNALGGAVAGASGHLIGKGLSGAGSKLGLAGAMQTTGGKMVHGAAVGVGADVSTQLITTGHVEGGSLLGSGLSGGAAVGLRAGSANIKGRFNGPPTGPTPHSAPPHGGTATTTGGTPVGGSLSGSGSGAGSLPGAGAGSSGTASPGAASSGASSGAGSSGGTGRGDSTPAFSRPDAATSAYQGPAGGTGTRGTLDGGGASSASAAGHTPSGSQATETGAGGAAAGGAGRSPGAGGLVPFGSDRSATPNPVADHTTGTPAAAPAHVPAQESAPRGTETAVPHASTPEAVPHQAAPAPSHAQAPSHTPEPSNTSATSHTPVTESTPRTESAPRTEGAPRGAAPDSPVRAPEPAPAADRHVDTQPSTGGIQRPEPQHAAADAPVRTTPDAVPRQSVPDPAPADSGRSAESRTEPTANQIPAQTPNQIHTPTTAPPVHSTPEQMPGATPHEAPAASAAPARDTTPPPPPAHSTPQQGPSATPHETSAASSAPPPGHTTPSAAPAAHAAAAPGGAPVAHGTSQGSSGPVAPHPLAGDHPVPTTREPADTGTSRLDTAGMPPGMSVPTARPAAGDQPSRSTETPSVPPPPPADAGAAAATPHGVQGGAAPRSGTSRGPSAAPPPQSTRTAPPIPPRRQAQPSGQQPPVQHPASGGGRTAPPIPPRRQAQPSGQQPPVQHPTQNPVQPPVQRPASGGGRTAPPIPPRRQAQPSGQQPPVQHPTQNPVQPPVQHPASGGGRTAPPIPPRRQTQPSGQQPPVQHPAQNPASSAGRTAPPIPPRTAPSVPGRTAPPIPPRTQAQPSAQHPTANPAPTPNPTQHPTQHPAPNNPAGTPGGSGTPHRPLTAQAAEQIHQTERNQRQAELDALRQGGTGRVGRTAQEMGREQQFTITRPPEAAQLVRDVPTMSAQERAQTLDALRPEYRRWLAKDPAFVDALRGALPPKEFATTAARLMVDVDSRTAQPVSARAQARAQAERLLQDPDVAATLLKGGAGIVVVPKDVSMTSVNAFHGLRGTTAGGSSGGGRGWDDVRGSGGRRAAVTEENLLGESTSVGNATHYQDGYSTTTHEFAHTVHQYGLPAADRAAITSSYQTKLNDPNAAWTDGPRQDLHGNPVDNYGSRDELEYFAQVTNAYLGTNHGTDPHTGQQRNNGPAWVRANEPALLPLLERLYGPDPVPGTHAPANPVVATRAENDMYEGFRDFMEGVDRSAPATAPPSHTPPAHTPPPAPSHAPPPVPGSAAPTPGAHGTPNSAHPVPPPPPTPTSHPTPDGMTDHETAESEFRLGTAALLEQTVVERLGGSGLGLPPGSLVLGGGGGVAALQLHRPVQDLDMRLSFGGDGIRNPNEVLRFLADEVLTDSQVVPGRRTASTTVTGRFGGLDVSITLAPVRSQEHPMEVVVNGETHNGETVPLKVVASEDLLGDKLAALAMRKQDAKVDVALLREKRVRDALDVLTLHSKLDPAALDHLRDGRESMRPAIGKLADVVAEVSKHSADRFTPAQLHTLEEISQRLGSEPTARPAREPKGAKPTPEQLAELRAAKEEAKRLKAAAAAAAANGNGNGSTNARAGGSTSTTDRGAPTGPPLPTPNPDTHTSSAPPPPPPPPPAFTTGPVSRGLHPTQSPPPPPPAPTGQGGAHQAAASHHTAPHQTPAPHAPAPHIPSHHTTGHSDGHTPMDTDSRTPSPALDEDMGVHSPSPEPGAAVPPAAPPRRPLPVAVQTGFTGDPRFPLRGDQVWLTEVLPSNDRPMTRFGTDQRSHTVPWVLTRRAAEGLANRTAESVWNELVSDIKEFQNFRPLPKGAAAADHQMVVERWNDIMGRLGTLPERPPADLPLPDWHRNLGDLVSGYIELSQITSFASFADGAAKGRGEAGMIDRIDRYVRGEGPAPAAREVVGTLLDIKENNALTKEDAAAAREHLIKSLHRAFPDYLTPGRKAEIEGLLNLATPVPVQLHTALPPTVEAFRRYDADSDLVADIAVDRHDPSLIGRIMLSEQARPGTQYQTQNSHAASWSFMRASLLSFEGRSPQVLEGWLGARFDEMHGIQDLDGPTRALVDHARSELADIENTPPTMRPARTSDLIRLFVVAHQKLPHTTFVDAFQLARATASGELDLGQIGSGQHDQVVASHFDGAAPFGMAGERLDQAYLSWANMAATLGPVGPETINHLADRSFSDKNMQLLLQAGRLRPLDSALGARYLSGLGAWERSLTTVFGDNGRAAVERSWGVWREEFTIDRFNVPERAHRDRLEQWFQQVQQADRPSDAAGALAGLTAYYQGLGATTSRSEQQRALRNLLDQADDAAAAAGGG